MYNGTTTPQEYTKQMKKISFWKHLCHGVVNHEYSMLRFRLTSGYSPILDHVIVASIKPQRGQTRKIVGVVFGWRKNKQRRSRNAWYLDGICADPNYKGIGSKMLQFYLLKAKAANVRSINIQSVPCAVQYWKKKGFVKESCVRHHGNPGPCMKLLLKQ